MTEAELRKLQELRSALARFREVLERDEDTDPIVLDAAVHRFEFSIELFWRVLQATLEREGIITTSPRAALRGAYAQGWLATEQIWLDMIEDRNRTSHTYREDVARKVFSRLPDYLAAMQEALAKLPID